MSSEENLLRQNCCRLCLAPDSECISILNSCAADKEPLASKIHNCVGIKIISNDPLSLRICHACISYLNSWQSFKNRCNASQNKQRNWLNFSKRQQLLDNNISISTVASTAAATSQQQHQQQQQQLLQQQQQAEQQQHQQHQQQQHHEEYHDEQSNLASSILDGISSLKKRKSLTVYVSPKQQQQQPQQPKYSKQLTHAPAQQQQTKTKQHAQKNPQHFKEKLKRPKHLHQLAQLPQHQQQQQQDQSVVAGTSFQSAAQQLRLFRRYSYNPLPAVQIKDEPVDDEDYSMKQQDESDEMMDPTLFLERTEEEGDEPLLDSTGYDYNDGNNERASNVQVAAAAVEVKEAACRACNLKFSTRANARRHERNLHPNLFELSTLTPNNTPITKPTPAFAAALELQRVTAAAVIEAAKTVAATTTAPPPTTISPQKYRQEVVNAFNKTEAGGFNYDTPEKYQQLLTDEKIVFLQQNEEFLRQYQNMTCRCCNKFYATYKNFMAHMRKKYATLPRNLCFNCLKLNDSKALFISHLKKRSCINLYKVLHTLMTKDPSFAAAVTATAAAAPEKLRAKELLVNKMYECKLCPKHFRLKLEFRSHVYEEHSDLQKRDIAPTQCSFCALEIEDAAERKRHYNNMDCIVSLRCVTCDSKFDNNQKFLDHVYEKHLAVFERSQQQQAQKLLLQQQLQQQQHQLQQQQQLQQFVTTDNSPGKKSSVGLGGTSSADESRSSLPSGGHAGQPKSQYFSRMPQACPICGQQYNNYNNVLRHMESKHPDQLPQTYKCVKCGIGYPRLSNLREHMVTSHAADKARHTGFEYIVNADAVKIADGSAPNVYTGRYDYVMKDLLSITNGGTLVDDDDDNDEHDIVAKKMRMDISTTSTVPNSSGGGLNSSNSANHSAANSSYTDLKECPICNAIFANKIGLSNHLRSHTAADQSAAAATMAAARLTTNSLTITATSTANIQPPHMMQHKTPAQQAIFKRSLEQAADRRFRRMRCRICQRRFSSKKSYRFHMLNDHQIRNVQFIKCKLCDAEFAYEKGLKVHMFKIHNTLLKDEMIIKQYECDICSIVYRTEQQLLQHKKTVHGNEDAQAADFADETINTTSEINVSGADQSFVSPASVAAAASAAAAVPVDRSSLEHSGPLLWYQCKYCPSNFNTNKKLAIHVNSHGEFDSNDYSCKDCGNVYSGRKSLWVHRYKKHPQIPEPSECELCKKIFFDSQMLENHIPTCNRKVITATGALSETATTSTGSKSTVLQSSVPQIYKHKTGDDEDDDASRDGDGDAGGILAGTLGGGEVEITAIPGGNMKIKMPDVNCTMCGQRFTDQELFAKHIQMHEEELYTDNPLAAMFDTGPADPNQFYLDRVNDNGDYACDMCQKTFTQMTAFKVHRKWHFRGDSKQNPAEAESSSTVNSAATTHQRLSSQTPTSHPRLLGLQAVGLMPRNPQPSRSQKRKRELKCEYCPSTFISNNNLRRHIYELHKEEVGNLPEPPKIELDASQHCRRCNVKFETKQEWIEHKVADARIMRPFGPFQWGCELCGAYVSRKEKLINHIHNHMKEQEIVPWAEQEQEQEQKQAIAVESENMENTEEIIEEEDAVLKFQYEEEVLEDEGADEDEVDEDEEGEVEGEEEGNGDEEGDGDEEVDGDYEEAEDLDFVEDLVEEVVNDVNEDANDGQLHNHEDNDEDVEEDDGDDAEEDVEMDDEEDGDDVEDTNDDDSNDATKAAEAAAKVTIKVQRNSADTTEAEDSPAYAGDDDDDEDDEEDNEEDNEDDDEDADTVSSLEDKKPPPAKSRYSCDLCRGVFFETQQELQKHVKMHFLNGPGSVTLTDIKSKSVNKSRSSSSDVLTVSSS